MESFPWLASHKRLSGRICKTHWINLCSLFSNWITLDHPIYPMLHRQRNLYFQSGPTRAYFLVSHMGVHMRFAWRESAKEDNRQGARPRLKVMSFSKPGITMPFDFRTIVTWFAHWPSNLIHSNQLIGYSICLDLIFWENHRVHSSSSSGEKGKIEKNHFHWFLSKRNNSRH